MKTLLSEMQHPTQPIGYDEQGVARFKKNAIVRWLAGDRLNEIGIEVAEGRFSVEDAEQFWQLLGYSVSGFGELDFMRSETVHAADCAAAALPPPARKP